MEKVLATRCDDYLETLQCVRGFVRRVWRYTRIVRADLAQFVCVCVCVCVWEIQAHVLCGYTRIAHVDEHGYLWALMLMHTSVVC